MTEKIIQGVGNWAKLTRSESASFFSKQYKYTAAANAWAYRVTIGPTGFRFAMQPAPTLAAARIGFTGAGENVWQVPLEDIRTVELSSFEQFSGEQYRHQATDTPASVWQNVDDEYRSEGFLYDNSQMWVLYLFLKDGERRIFATLWRGRDDLIRRQVQIVDALETARRAAAASDAPSSQDYL